MYIAQDGDDLATAAVAETFAPDAHHLQHLPAATGEPLDTYQKIARHYKFIFTQLIDCLGYEKVIFLEVCFGSGVLPVLQCCGVKSDS